jgi:hypothetical protein
MKRRMAVLLAYVLAFVLVPWASPKAATVQAATADQVMYGDRLAAPWSNWSWSSNVNLAYTATVYRGAQAISWRATAAWGGLYLHTNTAVPTTPTTKLQFAVRASQANQQLSVSIYGTNNRVLGTQPLAQVGGVPPANSWKAYDVPLSKLGAAEQQVTGVVLQDAAGKAQPNVLVDEIQLVGVATGTGTPPPTTNCSTVPAYTEIRPNNTPFNQTAGRPTDPAKFTGVESWRPYYNKINGACTGTTEQILEWAAKKWGFDQLGHADLAKAMAVVETWWDQRAVGAHGEVGILQVRPGWPDWEKAQNSTAYAADYAMAVVRSHYDGNSWLGAQTTHKLRDSVAAWECGCANNGANWYATRVWEYNQSKPWKRPGQPPEWF